ncbi:MAG: hypothetical protein RW306_07720 [Geobacteraceae bacterium]|nr:hypothetical protein [Geobacteraceae bacterium]
MTIQVSFPSKESISIACPVESFAAGQAFEFACYLKYMMEKTP